MAYFEVFSYPNGAESLWGYEDREDYINSYKCPYRSGDLFYLNFSSELQRTEVRHYGGDFPQNFELEYAPIDLEIFQAEILKRVHETYLQSIVERLRHRKKKYFERKKSSSIFSTNRKYYHAALSHRKPGTYVEALRRYRMLHDYQYSSAF